MQAVRLPAGGAAGARRLILALGGGILVFAPLAYGAVHPCAYFTVALVVAAAGLILLAGALLRLPAASGASFPVASPPGWWLGVGLILLTLIQLAPWPQSLVGRLAPAALSLRGLGAGFGMAPSLPLTLNPYATLLQFLKIWPAVVLFYLFIYTVDRRRQIHLLAHLILAVALFEVIYGALNFHSHLIWGWRNPYAGARLTGTFINSNHLGLLLTMALLLGCGLFLAQLPAPAAGQVAPRQGLLRRLARPQVLELQGRRGLLLLVLFLLGVGLIFTYSRSALAALLLGLALMIALTGRTTRSAGLALAGLLIAVVLYSLAVEGFQVFWRFHFLADQGRWQAYQGALAIWREFPWLGAGLGTYGDLSYRFETAALQGSHFLYAHSDWLQVLAEAGLGGFLLIAAAALAFFVQLGRQWRSRRDPWARGVGLGGLAALGAGLSQALVEFPFHIPALSYLLAGVAAITYLAVFSQPREPEFTYPVMDLTRRRPATAALLLILCGFQLVFIVQVSYYWSSEKLAPVEINSTRTSPRTSVAALRAALALNPRTSRNYWDLAEALDQAAQGDATRLPDVEDLFRTGIFFAPTQWDGHARLAEFALRRQQRDRAHYLPLALKELAAAAALNPGRAALQDRLATVLYWTVNYHPELVPPALQGWRPRHDR